jgi:uncharacterized tellurite resistance protein B-like protein
MLSHLRRLLSIADAEEKGNGKLQIATCALLLEMAYADHSLNPGEEELLRAHLQRHFHLDAEALESLIADARQARRESADLFQFAREINAVCNLEEKLAIMETLWRIVYADGVLDKYEDALARQLATLLRLSPRQAIDLKLKVLDETRRD